MNNNFSKEKVQFYDKLGSKYYHAFQKYKRKYPDIKNFKKNVINWLFSNDEETRMILCSIENKKYTNIIKEAYNEHDQSPYAKFYLKDSEDENEIKLFHINNSKLINNNSHDYYLKEINLIKDIKFYQCESHINDYSKYSNYFTFFNILKNQINFINVCDYFTNDKFLENPTKIINEFNKNFNFPEWIFKNNIPENTEIFVDNKSKINVGCFCSLPKLILALLEQVLSIRYLIYYDTNNLESILSSVYLYELFQKRNDIITYLAPKEKKFSYIYFKLDELAKDLYNDKKLKEFIESKRIKETSIFNIDNIEIYFNEEDDLNSIILEGNNFFNKFLKENEPKDFIDFFLLINIKQLFTYDDFYFRGIFEKIYETFLNQNLKDLILGEEKEKEKGNKKKRKKKKKKNEKNEDNKLSLENAINQKMNDKKIDFGDEILKILAESNINEDKNNNIINKNKNEELNIIDSVKEENYKEKDEINVKIMNDEERILITTFLRNLIYESLFKAIKLLEYQKNLMIKNEKKKNKEFFLFDATEKSKKKKKNKENDIKININKLNPNENKEIIERNAEENNIIKLKESIPLHINSLTFNSIKNENKKEENIIINNKDFIKQEKIFLYDDKDKNLSCKYFKILHISIEEYFNNLEEALIIQRKIKTELVNYFSSIIKIVYKNSELLVYGSSLYNLDIDTSDLDLSITTKEEITLLDLENYLKENNENFQYTKLNGIFSASVPIIKLEIDYLKLENEEIQKLYRLLKSTKYYHNLYNSGNNNYMNKINIDISLNSINKKQIEFIKISLSDYPIMRPLIKIIKKILQLKNMNNSYHGGMSSYCLFLLIYSYIKIYIKQIGKNENLNDINYGLLLIGALSFYINYIDFNYTLIDPCADNPFIINYNLETIPTIIEPISKQNAAKTIYKIFDVLDCLRDAYKDIFTIIEKNENTNINLIFELMNEYSKKKTHDF